jgi:YuzL-like protein
MEVCEMGKTKKDPSRIGLGSSHVQGQGTTTTETGVEKSSSRKKQKRD